MRHHLITSMQPLICQSQVFVKNIKLLNIAIGNIDLYFMSSLNFESNIANSILTSVLILAKKFDA